MKFNETLQELKNHIVLFVLVFDKSINKLGLSCFKL